VLIDSEMMWFDGGGGRVGAITRWSAPSITKCRGLVWHVGVVNGGPHEPEWS